MNAQEWLEKINKEPWECVSIAYSHFYEPVMLRNKGGPQYLGRVAWFDCKPLHESLDALRKFEDKLTEAQWEQYGFIVWKQIIPTMSYPAAESPLRLTAAQRLAALLAILEK